MKTEKSCGAVIYKKENDEIKYLIIHQNNGLWSFPKGHMEKGETELETAKREIKEETGLLVNIDINFKEEVEYFMKDRGALKQVVFFIAKPISDNVNLQVEELDNYKWLNYEESLDLITYDSSKETLTKANDYIKNME